MTYSLVQSLGSCSEFEYGNNQLFFNEEIAGVWRVRRYLMATDTLETISDNSSFEASDIINEISFTSGFRPYYIGGALIVFARNTGLVKAYRWDGGTTWTKTLQFAVELTTEIVNVCASATQVIVTTRNAAIGGTFNDYVVNYTSNGTAWSSGSIVWSSTPATFTPNQYALILDIQSGESGVIVPIMMDGAAESTSLARFRNLMRWDGSAWREIAWWELDPSGTQQTGDDWVLLYRLRDLLHWYAEFDGDLQAMRIEDAALPTGANSLPTGDPRTQKFKTLNFVGSGVKGFGKTWTGSEFMIAALGSDYSWQTDEEVTTFNFTAKAIARSSTSFQPFVVLYDGSFDHYIYNSATTYPDIPVGGSMALYVYKTENDGGDWEVRKVIT